MRGCWVREYWGGIGRGKQFGCFVLGRVGVVERGEMEVP